MLRRYGWRLIVSPTGVWRSEGFRYGLDNGAWTAHQSGDPWDAVLFRDAVESMGRDADWIVCPDVVGKMAESLTRTREWFPWLTRTHPRILIAVQDGMTPDHIDDLVGAGRWVGVFIGGTTGWKEASMAMWGEYKKKKDFYLHVGRVNTVRRIEMCARAGADSFDGTSPSRYASNTPRLSEALDRVNRQESFGW